MGIKRFLELSSGEKKYHEISSISYFYNREVESLEEIMFLNLTTKEGKKAHCLFLPLHLKDLWLCPSLFISPPHTLYLGEPICSHNADYYFTSAQMAPGFRVFLLTSFLIPSLLLWATGYLYLILLCFIGFGIVLHFYLHSFKFSKDNENKNSRPAFKNLSPILLTPNNYYSDLNLSLYVDSNLNNNYYLRPF